MLPWPSLAVQRKKKLRLPKLLLLLKPLLLLLLKPLLLLLLKPLLRLPLKPPLRLLLLQSNQTLFGLMLKGVLRHPFFIACDNPINLM